MVIIIVALLSLSILSVNYTLSSEGKIVFVNQKPLEKTFLKKYFYISGAVNNPGVYELTDENMRINDAINIAGGLSQDVDVEALNTSINLAENVYDAQQIVIPFNNSKPTESFDSSFNKVNINTATISELDELPNVGPSTAEKIILSRPYSSIEELKNVDGIGDKTYEELKQYVSI